VPDSSLFETTAEIAVAFAGFISIFLVLAARGGRFATTDALSIGSIVAGSVASVFYAFVPLVVHSLGLDGATLWRISSGLVVLMSGAAWASMVSLGRQAPERRAFFSFLPLVSNGLGAVALLSMLGNVCAWPWTPSAGVHLLAVWLTIAIVAIHFVVLIFKRVLVDPLPDTPSQPTG
jgi:hypothetical protein